MTGENGVFAGGDVVTGPESIISSIAQGRTAAKSIDLYLGGNGDISEILAEPEDEVILSEFIVDVKPRNEMSRLKRWQRVDNFDQIERGLTIQQAADEAGRCLSCDVRRFQVVVYGENCKECNYCREVCEMGTFGQADCFNTKGYRPMECKSSDWCVGCLKCFFSCPDFAIDVRELRS
jgi:NAD-dependent dihydropyrimidine dehydrogenase PreA subunit